MFYAGATERPHTCELRVACSGLPVFSSLIIIRRSPKLEGAVAMVAAWGPWAMFPLASAHGRCTAAALSCIQWKAHHKFPHIRGPIVIQYNTMQ